MPQNLHETFDVKVVDNSKTNMCILCNLSSMSTMLSEEHMHRLICYGHNKWNPTWTKIVKELHGIIK